MMAQEISLSGILQEDDFLGKEAQTSMCYLLVVFSLHLNLT